MDSKALRVLALEPYLGGSHEQFLRGLARHSRHQIDVVGLSAHSWKWRIRTGAVTLARQLEDESKDYDLLLVSDFLNLADFRALAPTRFARLPALAYFHENQLTYPVQVEDERDWNYAFINLTTALAAEKVLFNSEFHRDSFLAALRKLLKMNHTYSIEFCAERIAAKSGVLYPGIDFSSLDVETPPESVRQSSPPVIAWNHRWEFDKNPEAFFAALGAMKREGLRFRLLVLGESFRAYPAVFDAAREEFREEILHFGYCADKSDYARLLRRADVLISTADHEFFGIAVLEAAHCGCRLLLPRRLSYPELFEASHPEYFYDDQADLERKLRALLSGGMASGSSSSSLSRQYDWSSLIQKYDNEFETLAGR